MIATTRAEIVEFALDPKLTSFNALVGDVLVWRTISFNSQRREDSE